jgi:hypothetical protein
MLVAFVPHLLCCIAVSPLLIDHKRYLFVAFVIPVLKTACASHLRHFLSALKRISGSVLNGYSIDTKSKARPGFEPGNDGFANRCLSQLGDRAIVKNKLNFRYASSLEL